MRQHHIEICVKNVKATMNLFIQQLGFKLCATMENKVSKQWVVSNRLSTVVLTQAQKSYGENLVEPLEISQRKFDYSKQVDSVFNIAFEIKDGDIETITEKASCSGARILQGPTSVSNEMGTVKHSTIQTGFGNITHTFLDKRCYNGSFLPGYKMIIGDSQPTKKTSVIDHVDHVTYACGVGQTDGILEFYRKVFGMQRYLINRKDDPVQGLVVGNNIGIRLKACKCIQGDVKDNPFFLIVAEPLTNETNNHITKYLEQHGGPGIEHIAFHTDDMIESMRNLTERGVRFRKVPDNYYQNMALNNYVTEQSNLKKLGILYDEEDDDCQTSENMSKKKFLLQAFTTPIFDQETFFLEIIQRAGAIGLGTNNIVNLMKAIEIEQQRLQPHAKNDMISEP